MIEKTPSRVEPLIRRARDRGESGATKGTDAEASAQMDPLVPRLEIVLVHLA